MGEPGTGEIGSTDGTAEAEDVWSGDGTEEGPADGLLVEGVVGTGTTGGSTGQYVGRYVGSTAGGIDAVGLGIPEAVEVGVVEGKILVGVVEAEEAGGVEAVEPGGVEAVEVGDVGITGLGADEEVGPGASPVTVSVFVAVIAFGRLTSSTRA